MAFEDTRSLRSVNRGLASSRRRQRRTNPIMPSLVDALTELGPAIPEIARRMHQHNETVRYWYKTLMRRGFTIQVSVNYEKLGLRRVVAVVRFNHEYESFGENILTVMSELCYLQGFVRTLPRDHYIIHGAVPEELVGRWMEFIESLKDMGFFKSVEFSIFDWVRDVPMKIESYNFDEGIWEFEWSKAGKVYPAAIFEPSPKGQFDMTDLRVIKQLQMQPNKSLKDIQKQIGGNYKTLGFHYRRHVVARRLLKGHRVDWMGTRPGNSENRVEHRRHNYLLIDIIVNDIGEEEKAKLLGMTNAIPYLCWEAAGPSYYARLAFPTENITEALQFMSAALSPFGERAEWFMVDQARSAAFPISPEVFEPESGSWKFDRADLQGKFERLLLQFKKAKAR